MAVVPFVAEPAFVVAAAAVAAAAGAVVDSYFAE